MERGLCASWSDFSLVDTADWHDKERVLGFFQPRYLREGKIVVKSARKILRHEKDRLGEEKLAKLEQQVDALQEAVASGKADAIQKAQAQTEKAFAKVPGAKVSAWRENVEVIVVAVVLALGVRTYLLQPFKIPTGSMQPTLNGIIGTPMEEDEEFPPGWQRLAEAAFLGRQYFEIVSRNDEHVVELREQQKFLLFTETEIITTRSRYVVPASSAVVEQDFEVRPGKAFQPGEIIARGAVDTGDQVLVDKISYHFVPPRRSEVFVFRTTAIRGIRIPANMGAQHYIKRLAGLPGDSLQIQPPNLLVNGRIAEEQAFRRVMSQEDGYVGYFLGSKGVGQPELGEMGAQRSYLTSEFERFTLPEGEYFALGDNSNRSFDSRGWGTVPERNLVGRGMIVYYPFNKHWGLIQ